MSDSEYSVITSDVIKSFDCIWLRSGDLNCFRDIKPFMKSTGWGMLGHTPGDILASVIECLIKTNNIIYGLWVGDLNCFRDIKLFMK